MHQRDAPALFRADRVKAADQAVVQRLQRKVQEQGRAGIGIGQASKARQNDGSSPRATKGAPRKQLGWSQLPRCGSGHRP
jgi:hypothetical protein